VCGSSRKFRLNCSMISQIAAISVTAQVPTFTTNITQEGYHANRKV